MIITDNEIAVACLYETMGVTPEGGVEDLEAFVRHPQSRGQIYVTAEITLPDDVDLSEYDLETMEQIGNACGMRFHSIAIENSTQTLL